MTGARTSMTPGSNRGDEIQGGGNLFVATGDSITEANSDKYSGIYGDSWATYAALASGGRLLHIFNDAKGGETSAQIANRFTTEVLPLNHKTLIIAVGTNDSDANAQTLPNIESMIRRSQARGVRVALNTIPPAGSPPLGPPQNLVATAVVGGGTLAAGTYYYQISGRVASGLTLPSNEASVTLSATGSVLLSWDPLDSAGGYAFYGRVTGGSKGQIGLTGAGTSQPTPLTQFTDTGTATPGSALPSSNTALVANYTQAVRNKITTVNQVIHRLADRYGLPVTDQYSDLVDSTLSGQYKTGFSGDGTHPTAKIQKRMGINVWNALAGSTPARVPYLTVDDLDPSNMLYGRDTLAGSNGGLLSPHVGGDQFPSSWSLSGTGAFSQSLALDSNVAGYAYTITRGDYVGKFATTGGVNTGGLNKFAVGDLISCAFKLKSTGLDAIQGGGIDVGLQAQGGVTQGYITKLSIHSDVPATSLPGGWAIWYGESRIPPGCTDLTFIFNVTGPGVSASLAQVTVRNLTRLGLA